MAVLKVSLSKSSSEQPLEYNPLLQGGDLLLRLYRQEFCYGLQLPRLHNQLLPHWEEFHPHWHLL
ncbi:MAG: hypothetical protein ACJ8DI_09900 [Ktedonobacteraceae bacterium]